MIHMYGIHRMRKRIVVRYSFHVLSSDSFAEPGLQRISVLFLAEGAFYALDNICYAADLVVIGDGQLLHTGWLYPHLAFGSSGCPGNQLGNRPARRSLR
jgi:hypothetical protein